MLLLSKRRPIDDIKIYFPSFFFFISSFVVKCSDTGPELDSVVFWTHNFQLQPRTDLKSVVTTEFAAEKLPPVCVLHAANSSQTNMINFLTSVTDESTCS